MPIAKKVFVPCPEGTHVARCFACISLGTQHSEKFADSFKIMLMFELPNEMVDTEQGAKPMVISKEYSLSLGAKATLTQHLTSWRGRAFTPEEMKGFEVSNVVGAACQITIQHKTSSTGNVRGDITAITGLPKGMKAPDQWHPSIKYEIEDGKNEVYQSLPEWVRNKIAACEEWQPSMVKKAVAPEPPSEGDDNEVPF